MSLGRFKLMEPETCILRIFDASRGTDVPVCARGRVWQLARTLSPSPHARVCTSTGGGPWLPNSRQMAARGWRHGRALPACRSGGNAAGEAGGSAGALQLAAVGTSGLPHVGAGCDGERAGLAMGAAVE